jgi:hypothetical protein
MWGGGGGVAEKKDSKGDVEMDEGELIRWYTVGEG